ncbi:MAG: ATP-binding protein [Gammaproteobacteria bacterium]|nr:ATP-binding protein [Gammaproteobacteria bacterium]
MLNIIRGLGYAGARILVVDRQRRVRAETGSYQTSAEDRAEDEDWGADVFGLLRPLIRSLLDSGPSDLPLQRGSSAGEQVIQSSLDGEPTTMLRRLANGEEIIVAAHPIIASDRHHRHRGGRAEHRRHPRAPAGRAGADHPGLRPISLLAVFLVLLAFSVRLAWRIRSLGAETVNSIDQHGRLKTSQLRGEVDSGDEIGDLARSVSNMLSKLQQHNQFLENMPRTLRHEINNPLNALSTSLQNIEQDTAGAGRQQVPGECPPRGHADRRHRPESGGCGEHGGVTRGGGTRGDRHRGTAGELRQQLPQRPSRPPVHLSRHRPAGPRPGRRLPDRAAARQDRRQRRRLPSARHVRSGCLLDIRRDQLEITVANQGPPLDPEIQGSLFDSMVSHRSGTRDNRLHFGLGLYVVRVIAERHGGSVRAANLASGDGVAVTVTLPLASGAEPS